MELSEKKLKELKNNKISIKDLNKKYFVGPEYGPVEVDNILKLLNENICSFQEIVDKFKNIKDCGNEPCLYNLLGNSELLLNNKKLFEELIENNRLNTDDLKYLLNTIDTDIELDSLCSNTSLIKKILNEFILNKEDVDKFNTMIENIYWCKEENIHTVFDYIEYNESNKEILKLNELNSYLYNFNLSIDSQKANPAIVLCSS